MKLHSNIPLIALTGATALLNASNLALAQVDITGFHGNGRLEWTGVQVGSTSIVEWASALAPGPVVWQTFTNIVVTNTTMSADVPMFFRVRGVPDTTWATNSLIAYFPFNGNANDESGNAHHGAVAGATLAVDRYGMASKAYSFDGNDYIAVPDSAAFTLGTNDFTLSAWANYSSVSADGGYYLMGHSEGPGTTAKWIFWYGHNSLRLIVTSPGWVTVSTNQFDAGTWYHVAIRREGTNLTAFVNGVPTGSAPLSASIPNPPASLLIGTAEFDRPNRQFRGSIDEVRIYGRALSDQEMFLLATVVP